MPLKLSVGFQKKVGLPDYGSQGASCSVDFEIDSSLLQNNLEGFHQKARAAFIACQQVVNDQLARHNGPPANGHPPNPPPTSNGNHATTPSNGNGHRNGNGAKRQATQSQARAIRAIATRQRLDLQNLLQSRYGVAQPEGLSISDASSLIDELKNPPDDRGGHA